MLRILLDLLYENEMEEAITACINVVESHLTPLQREELFKMYNEALEATAKEDVPDDLPPHILANPNFCEGCEE